MSGGRAVFAGVGGRDGLGRGGSPTSTVLCAGLATMSAFGRGISGAS